MSLSSRTGWFLVLTTFLKLNIVIPKTLYMSRQLWPLPRLQYLHGNNLQNPPTHSPQPMLIEIYKQKTKPYPRCLDKLEMIENSTQYSLKELPPPPLRCQRPALIISSQSISHLLLSQTPACLQFQPTLPELNTIIIQIWILLRRLKPTICWVP